MHIKIISFLWMILISGSTFSQQHFGLRCVGKWKGTMLVYSQGILRKSDAEVQSYQVGFLQTILFKRE
ncbi:hypothetical protein [Fluviicola chungangensis]|uniref:Uncharacterized protein n=1 Tax=Fluviicola chungangensis TaxID=2597671 RepID=A0A556N3B4_9FLAO|nr:hypothetical protein [Fluviicola chungangensis]TSJ46697.1 hypothetical protein FO442_05930 [Fluviicola chungangensis]